MIKKLFLLISALLLFALSAQAFEVDGDLEVTRDSFVDRYSYSLGVSTTGVLPVDGSVNTRFIDFDLLYIGMAIEGRLQWNADDGTLEFCLPGGDVCLQIGQEMVLPRARNGELTTILDGQLVYIYGATGKRPIMKLAIASDHDIARATLAMATEDILPNQLGYFTTFGNVRNLGTFGFAEGTPLFLSATIYGDYTDIEATQPDTQVCIGRVIYEHNTEGIIFLKIESEPNLDELSDVLAGSYVDEDFLVRDTVLGVWKNTQLDIIGDNKYVRRDGTTALTAAWDSGAFDIKAISFSIGAFTLNAQEWGFLDGQDQYVFSDSYVYFGQIHGSTKWGLTNPYATNVHWIVEEASGFAGLLQFPRLVAIGEGLFPRVGAIANALFIHANIGEDSRLTFASFDFTKTFVFLMDELTGAFTVTGSSGTIWNDDFNFPDNYKFTFGTGFDVENYYDGINYNTVTDAVAASDWLINCGTNKTVELIESVWDDLQLVSGAFQFLGSTDPSIQPWQPGGAGATFLIYKFQKNDEAFGSLQMKHTYNEGTDIYFHIHWTPADRGIAEIGNYVGWKADYTIANVNGVFPVSGTVDLSDIVTGVDDKNEVTGSVSVPGSGLNISFITMVRIYRSDTGADDTWAGVTAAQSPGLLEFDIHFEINTIGSRQPFAK